MRDLIEAYRQYDADLQRSERAYLTSLTWTGPQIQRYRNRILGIERRYGRVRRRLGMDLPSFGMIRLPRGRPHRQAKTIPCLVCGKTFPVEREQQRYCSRECYHDSRLGIASRPALVGPRRKRNHVPRTRCVSGVCRWCAKPFTRLTKLRPPDDRGLYCSRSCNGKAQRWVLVGPPSGRVFITTSRGLCASCGRRFTSERRRDRCRQCVSSVRWVVVPMRICNCGSIFGSVAGRDVCSAECADLRRIASRRKFRTTATCKRLRRIHKAKRRLKTRVAADRIDPMAVFERDRWRCQLCGVRTPKALRGSFDPRAPEMDHIVTLADGGTHTWGNVQCACRQCNGDKGSRSRGQIGLALECHVTASART